MTSSVKPVASGVEDVVLTSTSVDDCVVAVPPSLGFSDHLPFPMHTLVNRAAKVGFLFGWYRYITLKESNFSL